MTNSADRSGLTAASPAKKTLTKSILASLALTLAASLASAQDEAATPADDVVRQSVESSNPYNPDPWESFNRKIYAFNDVADRYFLKPIAKGYQWIAPQFVEDGVHHVFNNLGEVGNILNSLLQAKFKNTAVDTGRFLVNSTVGLLGFFDVASKIGLDPHPEDFGQTLGYWGLKSGPYIVVPLLGPRTIRDGFGNIADVYTSPTTYVDHVPTRNQITGMSVIDTRAQLLQSEELISGDRYIFIRDAYLQRREYLVNDGVVEDSFGNDEY